jgi:type I restriction enzyme R subunit
MDRIELNTIIKRIQRLFSDENEEVQATENTSFSNKIEKCANPANTLIVTSIQKMSNINKEEDKTKDIEIMNNKRIVLL